MTTLHVTGDLPLHILIVEDSRTQAERLRHVLQREGYRVDMAADGRLALDRIEARRPDLVITDINMPGLDGYSLARRLKADSRWRAIPVLLVTSMSDPQDVIRGLQCGADGFVLKPYEEAYLLARIRDVLANVGTHCEEEDGSAMVVFNGQRHRVTASRTQAVNLLLSTYEAVIRRNREIARSKQALELQAEEIGVANRFLDAVIENIPHAVFVKDARNLRLVRVNRAMEEALGKPRAELLGQDVHGFLPAQAADAITAIDRQVVATGQGQESTDLLPTTGGELRMISSRKTPIPDASGRPRYVLGISEDVTERTRRERDIQELNAALAQRTAEADAANRAKTVFLATMSHEIRTPMNGMLGMLELLERTQLDACQRDTLAIVRSSSAALLRIVDDILDFSKIEAGQLEIRPEAVSVTGIVTELQRTYESAAASKGLVLRSRIDPRLCPVLQADGLRLRQILGNFISNALKFTDHGGIEVVVEPVHSRGDGQWLRFQVRDTGVGISAEAQRQLFQPFRQGDAEVARRAGGTGLGLTICRRLAELMGGSVHLESRQGQGTTVSLELPLGLAGPGPGPGQPDPGVATPPPAEPAAVIPGPVPATSARVLVVDDHSTNRLLLSRQLQVLGHQAESAADGEQALALWASGRFDLVISDCEMPGMDGYALARAIRRQESECSRPRTAILACTAHALSGEVDKCKAAGMDDVLVKPVSLRHMEQALTRWLPSAGAAAQAENSEAPLDLALIARTWGDARGIVEEVLASYCQTGVQDLIRTREAVGARDGPQVCRLAHKLLGASRMVGAQGVAAACESLEAASRSGAWPAAERAAADLDLAWERLERHVRSVGLARAFG